jgi:hypothetical protein
VSSTTASLKVRGTPSAAATDSFAVKVTGCGGDVSQVSYKIIVHSTVAISTTSLPNGTIETAYSAAIQASGGCTPYKWEIASGALPAGVTAKVSSTTTSLKLSGRPSAAAADSFVVKVTGCGGHVSQVSYKIVIQASANHVVDLSWNASTSGHIAGYNVYRCPDGVTWKKINASLIGLTVYIDSTVAKSTTYYYSATAVDIHGNESSGSAVVKVVIP